MLSMPVLLGHSKNPELHNPREVHKNCSLNTTKNIVHCVFLVNQEYNVIIFICNNRFLKSCKILQSVNIDISLKNFNVNWIVFVLLYYVFLVQKCTVFSFVFILKKNCKVIFFVYWLYHSYVETLLTYFL